MSDFDATIHSLGEHLVDYIGRDHLQQLTVTGREPFGEADVEICLQEDTWEEQSWAIDRVLAVREMFLNELSITYRFISPGGCEQPRNSKRTDFALA